MTKNKKPKHIAVAGNIGAGKTTLTEMLSKHYRWIPQFEDVDHNPYLNDFYEDMPRWSFNLQIFFLNSRLNQLLEIHTGTETVIQDRTIYEDAHIFAPNLHEMGLMSKRDYNNYFQFFQTLKRMVQPPDLLIGPLDLGVVEVGLARAVVDDVRVRDVAAVRIDVVRPQKPLLALLARDPGERVIGDLVGGDAEWIARLADRVVVVVDALVHAPVVPVLVRRDHAGRVAAALHDLRQRRVCTPVCDRGNCRTRRAANQPKKPCKHAV